MKQVEVDRKGVCQVLVESGGAEVEENQGVDAPGLREAREVFVVRCFAVLFAGGN